MLLGVFQKGKNVIYSIFFIINKISLINIFNILVKLDKDDRLFTPGPTKYNVEIKAQNPKWTINGAKRRSHIKKPKTPGCGRYEYKSYIGEGPKYSFGFSRDTCRNPKCLDESKTPGPSYYFPYKKYIEKEVILHFYSFSFQYFLFWKFHLSY